ncbi:murein hydrolase activator EnvC family protein [Eubacterium sp.]|uniref:murein hydrolase activator EnvC family protein n=1 Tax=Eubacterium sp. TaxID=142586 RepID=UPI002FC5BD3E
MAKKMLVMLLCVCFALSCIGVPALAATTDDLNNAVQKIKDTQYQIDMTKNTIKGIEEELSKSNAVISALDEKMEGTKQEIAVAEAKRAQQEAELEERLRIMYMYGDDGYMEVLFSSKNFTELLTRIDQVKNIMQSDRDAVNALEQTKKEIESKIADLETDKASAESLKTQQNQLLAQNNTLLAQQQAAYDAEYAAGEDLAKQLGLSGLNGIIQTGEYYWPIDPSNPKAFNISDWFGQRSWGATNGVGSTNHQGIDITPGNGEPILAIADGTVVQAGENGGYGNCVTLNNGQNASGVQIGSIYAHMSNVAVSAGQTVTKGQVLGYVGSTGNSTGPHLHLSILENGTMVDPMTYFPQYQNSCVWVG